jgi:hypothetical protein
MKTMKTLLHLAYKLNSQHIPNFQGGFLQNKLPSHILSMSSDGFKGNSTKKNSSHGGVLSHDRRLRAPRLYGWPIDPGLHGLAEVSLAWLFDVIHRKSGVVFYINTYHIWLLIKIPLSGNGHSLRIKLLLLRNFRELHVYLSWNLC